MLNNQQERRFKKEFEKFIDWSDKHDSIIVYIIGHENPLPDGDCICSTYGFSAGLKYIFNNKFSGIHKPIKTRIVFHAKKNPYMDKVMKYIEEAYDGLRHDVPSELNYFHQPSLPGEKNEMRFNRIDFDQSEDNLLEQINFDVEYEKHEGKVGLAFFVLDTDYLRTGFAPFLEKAFFMISNRNADVIKEKSQLFYGIIDHHIIKEGEDLKFFHEDAHILDQTNRFDLRFPSNAENGASSTCEIVCNLFNSYYHDLKELEMVDDYKDKRENFDYKYQIQKTLLKVLMGGMRTDTGNFLFNGHQTALIAISEYINRFELHDYAIQMDQKFIQNIVEPKKDITNTKIYAYLNDCIESVLDFDDGLSDEEYGRFSGFAYMIVDDYHFDEEKEIKISELGIKPIHVLQEYEWKAAVAITINSIERTLKLELRSSEEKYNCRKLAQAIHPSGGGHLQAAGVTVEVPKEEELFAAAKTLAKQFVDYMKECEK